MGNKVLLVLEMQEDYIGEARNKSMYSYDAKKLINIVNSCITSYDPDNVIYVKNVIKNNLIHRIFTRYGLEGTSGIELVKGLKVVSNHIYEKQKLNAFEKNMELYYFLEERKIDTLELVGLDGGGCVAMTAQTAAEIGYKVEINKKAVGTVLTKRANMLESALKTSGVKYV